MKEDTMKRLMIGFLLSAFLAVGCTPLGSPTVNINKNVYVLAGGSSECERDNGVDGCQCVAKGIDIVYFTTSETGVTAQIEQQLKDLLDLKLPSPIP